MNHPSFPTFGVLSQMAPGRSTTTFVKHGFLSGEADDFRLSASDERSNLLDDLKSAVEKAHSDIASLPQPIDGKEFHALAFWVRTLEACQGAALLADYGMPGTAAAALRTGVECLFYACALWRSPGEVVRIQGNTSNEMFKMAEGIRKRFSHEERTAEVDEQLNLHQDKPDQRTMSAQEAAELAGLAKVYESTYRGLGAFGAHATERSQEPLYPKGPPERPTAQIGPDFSQSELLIKGAYETLQLGRERFREHFSLLFS